MRSRFFLVTPIFIFFPSFSSLGIFCNTRSFFEAVAFVHVRFARVRFVLELFFVFETKFFSIVTRWRV
jgi:hypothetical protein